MVKRIRKQLHLFLVLLVALGGAGLVLASLAMAKDAGTADTPGDFNTLDRDAEPVIVPGAAVGAFAGVRIDQLFAYAYREAGWEQIPFQVDEVTLAGAFTSTEDSLLDSNDELVFMAMDAGNRALPTAVVTSTLPISDAWYEIQVTDPLTSAMNGWVYLFRSNVLAPTATSDYVDFDANLHRINGTNYSLSLGTTHRMFESLTLNGGPDILDRNKLRAYSAIPFLPPLTEDLLGPVPDDLITDGPVRAILRGGKGLAYGSIVQWKIPIPLLVAPYKNAIRFSTDFSAAASGSTLYSRVVSQGVSVDGAQDVVPATPLSPWWQLSTEYGSLLQVGDSSSIGGEQTNYYLDDLALDPGDTGDGRSYGDVGVRVENPLESFTYAFALYSVPITETNVGEMYYERFSHPLSATTSLQARFSVALDAAPDSLTVDGGSTLTATVLDLSGRPISDTLVAFMIVSGPGTVTPGLAPTDEAGRATASLSSQAVGDVRVKASVGFVDSNTEAIEFTAGEVTTVTLEAMPDTLSVGQSSTLTATTVDQYSNPVSGTVVTFTVVSGQGTLSPTIGATDEAGQAMTSLSSHTAGDVTVTAGADDLTSDSQTVTFRHLVHLPLLFRDDSG
jgi:hypothetical protein